MNRRNLLPALVAGLAFLASGHALADGDAQRGAKAFRVCAACHSLRPGLNMTGPSLAGVWGRQAGKLPTFDRYSPALKSSGVTWNASTLNPWLKSPAQFIPGNWMTFAGLPDAQIRADLIAFLRAVGDTQAGASAVTVPNADTRTPADLKRLQPGQFVTSVRNCGSSYFVATADGKTHVFWDQSLRFETDASKFGPLPGKPAMLPAGMMGDRATIVFAKPEEISPFIKPKC